MIELLRICQKIIGIASLLSILLVFYYFPGMIETIEKQSIVATVIGGIGLAIILFIQYKIEKKERTIYIEKNKN